MGLLRWIGGHIAGAIFHAQRFFVDATFVGAAGHFAGIEHRIGQSRACWTAVACVGAGLSRHAFRIHHGR